MAVRLLSLDMPNFFWRAVELLDQFQGLISKTFWWPSEKLDGMDAVEKVSMSDTISWLRLLQKKAVRYVAMVNSFKLKAVEIEGSHVTVGNTLHEPKLHRLVELYQF